MEGDSESNVEEEKEVTEIDPLKRFDNLYWSRMISLQDFIAGENERWPMKPDINENKEILDGIVLDEDARLEPYFDPYSFSEMNNELTVD